MGIICCKELGELINQNILKFEGVELHFKVSGLDKVFKHCPFCGADLTGYGGPG